LFSVFADIVVLVVLVVLIVEFELFLFNEFIFSLFLIELLESFLGRLFSFDNEICLICLAVVILGVTFFNFGDKLLSALNEFGVLAEFLIETGVLISSDFISLNFIIIYYLKMMYSY